jgi:hypothetical protein
MTIRGSTPYLPPLRSMGGGVMTVRMTKAREAGVSA